MHHQEVIDYWFSELSPDQWWKKDASLDSAIRSRFGAVQVRAARAELFEWRKTAEGRLAEIIVLDQFSRNIFRDTPAAFDTDPLALVLAQCAVAERADDALNETQRGFLYMPYMHSESALIHEVALELFSKANPEYLGL